MTPRRPALAATSPLLVLGLTFLLAACTTATPSASPTPGATVLSTTAPSASPVATIAVTAPAASPTPVSGTAACDPASLAASITKWEGAAGHRNATVQLVNNGSASCTIHVLATPQLVDANGAILIQGDPPASAATIVLASNEIVTTMVSDANYCGALNPALPVTIAFVFPGGEGRVVAAPAADNTLGGVPPCNGAAGSPGDIEMQPFTP